METQATELVSRLLTLEWAGWALPVSIVFSLFVRRPLAVLLAACLATVLHLIGPSAIPALLSGESVGSVVTNVMSLAMSAQPALVAVQLVAYAFLIFVFSLTRRDMFRDYVQD
jgi:hypothetical protein